MNQKEETFVQKTVRQYIESQEKPCGELSEEEALLVKMFREVPAEDRRLLMQAVSNACFVALEGKLDPALV